MNKLHVFLFAVLLLAGHSVLAAPGDIYYVDKNHPNASDANPGTEQRPWKTIQKAANVLTAGETVYVKDGVYQELHGIEPNSSFRAIKPQHDGTSGSPITFAAYPGHHPVIDQNYQGPGFFMQGSHYIVIDGFEIRKVSRGGVWNNYAGSSHITVQNNYIHDVNSSAGNVGGVKFDGVSNGIIRNNIIHDVTVAWNRTSYVPGANGACIHSYDMQFAVIENNLLYACYNGIFHKRSTGQKGADIRNNIFRDLLQGVYLSNAASNSPPHINHEIYQNIFYNTGVAIKARTKDIPKQSRGLKIYNNVFDKGSLQISGFAAVQIWNNIFRTDGYVLVTEDGGTNFWETEIIYADYNLYYPSARFHLDKWGADRKFESLAAWQQACKGGCAPGLKVPAPGPDQHGIEADPLFEDAAAHNYRLKTGSPALAAGRNGQAIGAYPVGNEIIGPAVRPSPPTGLTVQ